MTPSPAGDVGESDGHDTPQSDKECLALAYDWIKDKRNLDKWRSEATGHFARYRKLPGQL